IYALARRHGAWGGKITGAGGGGFMVFACPFDRRLEIERVLSDAGVKMRPFSFSTQGVHAWSVDGNDERWTLNAERCTKCCVLRIACCVKQVVQSAICILQSAMTEARRIAGWRGRW